MRKNEKLTDLLTPAVEALGYTLIGIDYHPNSVNALLRIYIDKDGGVELDDCVAVNQQVSGVLDVEDPIPGKYTLEISSPGMDRPLFSIEDFERFVGSLVKVRLSRPIERQRNFKGTIIAVNDEIVTIDSAEGVSFELAFSLIETARLVPVF